MPDRSLLAACCVLLAAGCAGAAESAQPQQPRPTAGGKEADQPERYELVSAMVKTCACRCGGKFFEVNPSQATCKAAENAPCVTDDGNLSKLTQCGQRYMTVTRKVPVERRETARGANAKAPNR